MFLRISDDEAPEGARFTPVNQPMMPGQMPGMQPGQPMPSQAPPMGGVPGMGMPGQMPPQMPPQMGNVMPMGMGMGMPPMQPPVQNALAEMDVDIIIEAAPDMITLQHEQFEQLTAMVQAGVPIPPDVLIEASQLRNKKQLAEKLDAGMQLQQAQQQLQEMQKQLQQAQAELQKAQMPKPEAINPLDMARAQDLARKADRDDALAQATIRDTDAGIALKAAQATQAQASAYKAVEDANRPPPAPKAPPKG